MNKPKTLSDLQYYTVIEGRNFNEIQNKVEAFFSKAEIFGDLSDNQLFREVDSDGNEYIVNEWYIDSSSEDYIYTKYFVGKIELQPYNNIED